MYSIATNYYPDNQQLIVGIVEVATGLGLIFGPILGSFLAEIFGYQATFLLQGIALFIYSLIVKIGFPEGDHSELHEHLLHHDLYQRKATMTELLRIPRFILAALAGSLTYFTYSFMEPILAIRLNDFTNLSQIRRGLFFAVMPCFYIPASLIIQYVPSKIEKRVVIISSMVGLFIAFLLVGPSMVSVSSMIKI